MTVHSIPAGHVKLKHVYDPVSPEDRVRVLVDRLWPRGLKKANSAIDRWVKDIAPSTELRQWFGHDPQRWPEFRRRYIEELHQHAALIEELRSLAREGPLTLLFSAHNEAHNNAVVIREVLLHR